MRVLLGLAGRGRHLVRRDVDRLHRDVDGFEPDVLHAEARRLQAVGDAGVVGEDIGHRGDGQQQVVAERAARRVLRVAGDLDVGVADLHRDGRRLERVHVGDDPQQP